MTAAVPSILIFVASTFASPPALAVKFPPASIVVSPPEEANRSPLASIIALPSAVEIISPLVTVLTPDGSETIILSGVCIVIFFLVLFKIIQFVPSKIPRLFG